MKVAEFQEYARTNHKRPAGTVLCFEEPADLNEVILYGQFRFRLTRQLTRDEFLSRLRENAKHCDEVRAVASARGSLVNLGSLRDVPEPGPEMRYFYAAEVI